MTQNADRAGEGAGERAGARMMHVERNLHDAITSAVRVSTWWPWRRWTERMTTKVLACLNANGYLLVECDMWVSAVKDANEYHAVKNRYMD